MYKLMNDLQDLVAINDLPEMKKQNLRKSSKSHHQNKADSLDHYRRNSMENKIQPRRRAFSEDHF